MVTQISHYEVCNVFGDHRRAHEARKSGVKGLCVAYGHALSGRIFKVLIIHNAPAETPSAHEYEQRVEWLRFLKSKVAKDGIIISDWIDLYDRY